MCSKITHLPACLPRNWNLQQLQDSPHLHPSHSSPSSALRLNQLPHHSLHLHSPLPFYNKYLLDHTSSIKSVFWPDLAQLMTCNLINPYYSKQLVFLHAYTSPDGAVPDAADSPTHDNHDKAPKCSNFIGYSIHISLFLQLLDSFQGALLNTPYVA